MNWDSLVDIANGMVEKGKGILAADESTPTCTKRFDSIGVDSTAESRNAYRDMLFTAPGMEEFISGVILFDETIRQSTLKDGVPFPDYFKALGIIPGIKVDKGSHPMAGTNGEEVSVSPELSLVFPFFRHFNGSLNISETFSRSRSRNPDVPGSENDVGFQLMHGNAQIGTTLSRIFSRESGRR